MAETNKQGFTFIEKLLNKAIFDLETKDKNKMKEKVKAKEDEIRIKYTKLTEAMTKKCKELSDKLAKEMKESGVGSGSINMPYVSISGNSQAYYAYGYPTQFTYVQSKEVLKAQSDRDALLMRLALGKDVTDEVTKLIKSIQSIA